MWKWEYICKGGPMKCRRRRPPAVCSKAVVAAYQAADRLIHHALRARSPFPNAPLAPGTAFKRLSAKLTAKYPLINSAAQILAANFP